MQILKNILSQVTPVSVKGDLNTTVSGLCIDSRCVLPGHAFIANKGTLTDGHAFIETAISKGASTII